MATESDSRGLSNRITWIVAYLSQHQLVFIQFIQLTVHFNYELIRKAAFKSHTVVFKLLLTPAPKFIFYNLILIWK